MASYPVEVLHSYKYMTEDYYDNDSLNFRLAKMFSDSTNHFTIIDSYSSEVGVGRYKGDPIKDSVWVDEYDDVGENNSWFVVECQSEHPTLAALGYSGLPKWQLKIQWCTAGTYLADVSDPTGGKYPKNHGAQYYSFARFGPYGGWDLEDSLPDFNPIFPPSSGDISSQNNRDMHANPGWLSAIFADGCAIILCHSLSGQYYTPMIVAGDVLPPSIDHMPMPRAMLCSGSSVEVLDHTGFLNEDGSWSNQNGYNYVTDDRAGGGVAFWDEGENLVQAAYQTQRCRALAKKQGNHHATDMEIDSFPFMVIPKVGYGARFALGHIRKGWGRGCATIQNKTLMTGWYNWTAIFPWDGASSPMR